MFSKTWQLVLDSIGKLKEKGSFTRNFAITLSGSTLSTVLGVLMTPIASRIYAPNIYGQFAIYASVMANLSVIATLSYPNAFLLPKKKENFIQLVQLTICITLAVCLLVSLALLIGGPYIVHQLNAEGLGGWIYTIPVLLLIVNMSSIISTWLTRNKEFGKRAGVDIISNIGGRVFTIGFGLLIAPNVVGMLLGEFFNRIVNLTSLLAGNIRYEVKQLWETFSWTAIKAVAYEYRDFPLFALPSSYVYVLSSQLPIFMLAPAFGASAVGLYAFSMGLLEMPISLLAGAIAPVFMQKATEVFHETPERLGDVTLRLFNRLLYIGLLPFGVITVYGDIIFKVFFGSKWEMAGVFTGYLGFYYIFKLLSLSTGSIYSILSKQRSGFYINALLLVARALGLSIGIWFNDLKLTLLLFGVASLVATFAADLYVLSLLKLPVVRIGIRTILMVVVVLIVLKFSRYGLAYAFPNLF